MTSNELSKVQSIWAILDKMEVDFVIAYEGKIAIEKVQLETFDLIISDIAMPDMDGYQVDTTSYCADRV